MSKSTLTEPAKLLLLVTLLAKDHIISTNGKTFIKELIIRRDLRMASLIEAFEKRDAVDMSFLEQIHDIIGSEAQTLYNDLFAETSLEIGKTLSKREREDKDLNDEKSLIYGEVEFDSFYRILRKINPEPGGVFYDLGSGTGKALFVARLTRDFRSCIGIEILESLHQEASRIVRRYNQTVKPLLALELKNEAAVHSGSFASFDWSDGDLVFANSTCFSDELMADIARRAARLKPGAILVTFTKGLTSPVFELLERKRYRMSWGPATVFIHRRLAHNGQSVGPVKFNVMPSDATTYVEDGESSSGLSAAQMSSGYYASLATQHQQQQRKTGYKDDDIDGDNGDEDEEEEEEDDEEDEAGDEDEEEEEGGGGEEDEDDEEGDEEEEEEEEEEEGGGGRGGGGRRSEGDDENLYKPSTSHLQQQQQQQSSSNSPLSRSLYSTNGSGSAQQQTPSPRVMASNGGQSSADRVSMAVDFSNMLGSPQDNALLMRKRVAGNSGQSSADRVRAAVDFSNMLGSPQDTALLMRKRAAGKSNPSSTHVTPPQAPMQGDDE